MPTVPMRSSNHSNGNNRGVRRPLGNIHIHHTSSSSNNSNSQDQSGNNWTKKEKPDVVKKAPFTKRETSGSSQSSATASSSSPVEIAIAQAEVLSQQLQAQQQELEASSVFRRTSEKDQEEASDDMLSLQIANSVHDVDDAEWNDATQDESIFLPFTRADGCKILEPLDTRSLRSIFRRRLDDAIDDTINCDGSFMLKLANLILDEADEEELPVEKPECFASTTKALYIGGPGHLSQQQWSIQNLMNV